MTSQTTIDESVFGNLGLSRSLKTSESDSEKLRRRHKSTSDIGLRRAATLQEYDAKLRHQSSDMDNLHLSNALSAKVSKEMEQEKSGGESSEKTNSRLSGASVKPGHSTIPESGQEAGSVRKVIEGVPRTSGKGDGDSLTRRSMGLDLKDKSEPNFESSVSVSKHLLDMSPTRMEPVRALAKKPVDIFSDLENLKTPVTRTSSLGSNTSSPSHSVRTPVTENDPLGLFSPPSNATIQTSLSGMPDLLGLNDSKDSGISTATSRSANRSNLLIDIEPFRSPSKDRLSSTDSALSTPKNIGAGDGDTRTYTLLKTSSSMSSNDTSSPGSPAGAWAPLSQSQSTPSERGDGQSREEETVQKSSLESLDKTPDNKPHSGTPSSKRGKMLARGESFRHALSSTAKTTASFLSSRFSSKFAEIKQSMSPASNNSLDKIDSDNSTDLPKAHEMDKNLEEDDTKEEKGMKKAGSEELLDKRENFRNQGDTRSLDDTLDGTPNKSRPTVATKGTYAGYGELLIINSNFGIPSKHQFDINVLIACMLFMK